MAFEVVSVEQCSNVKGTHDFKQRFVVRCTRDGTEYIVLYWPTLDNMIVYDGGFKEHLKQWNWRKSVNLTSYVNAVKDNITEYMHVIVFYTLTTENRYTFSQQ